MVPSQFTAPAATRGPTVAVLFPGALGDFLCLAPALFSLRRRARVVLVLARTEWTALLPPPLFRAGSIEGRAVAELFGGSRRDAAEEALASMDEVYSFTGDGDADFERRLRSIARGRVEIFPFRGFLPDEHASAYYSRCLRVEPGQVDLWISDDDRRWAVALASRLKRSLLAVHAGSGAARKNWTGFTRLAAMWKEEGGAVVEIVGPAESGRRPLPGDDLIVEEPLPRVAALLEQVTAYAGNDSGITHLASTLGVDGVAVFGSSDDTEHWRPLSARLAVVVADRSCDLCPGLLCEHRLRAEVVSQPLRDAAHRARERTRRG